MGIMHRQLALQCMQLAIVEGTSQTNYKEFMTALLSLITIGVGPTDSIISVTPFNQLICVEQI
jgi:hypothetical protein